jgi:hypothetical protein
MTDGTVSTTGGGRSAGADAAPPRRARRTYGGRRAIVGLLFIAAVCCLWWRSYRHWDGLAVYGPRGEVSGVASLRGELMASVTNVPLGQEPWTATAASEAAEEGERLRALLAESPNIAGRWGFLLVRHGPDAWGLSGRWATVVAGPHWVLLPLGAWPVAGWAVRRGRWWRWRRRGQCLACGYDLRGIEGGRCPECGEERPTTA